MHINFHMKYLHYAVALSKHDKSRCSTRWEQHDVRYFVSPTVQTTLDATAPHLMSSLLAALSSSLLSHNIQNSYANKKRTKKSVF